MIVCILTEGLVRTLVTFLIDRIQIVGVVHYLGVWLVNLHGRSFLRLRSDITYSAHATLKPYVIHLIHRLTCLLDDSEMTVFVDGTDLTFEAVHEI